MSGRKKSRERDPVLLRLANGVDGFVGLLTAETGILLLGLLVALILGASLLGILLEVLIGALVLGSVAAVGALVMLFFSAGP